MLQNKFKISRELKECIHFWQSIKTIFICTLPQNFDYLNIEQIVVIQNKSQWHLPNIISIPNEKISCGVLKHIHKFFLYKHSLKDGALVPSSRVWITFYDKDSA